MMQPDLPVICLQYMGHPIANDTQYGGTLGPPLAFRRLMQNQEGQDHPAAGKR